MTFCGTQLQELETTIRKEMKAGPSKTRLAGLDGTKMVKKLKTIDDFCSQHDVCQSSLGLGRLIFRNCHGKHPLDV